MDTWYLEKLGEQWAAIQAAPLAFAIAVVVSTIIVGASIFFVLAWFYKERFETQEARISLLTERLEQQRAPQLPVDKVAEANEVTQQASLQLLTSDERTPNSNDIEIKGTRAEWWDSNIQCVIRDAEKLVVMDSTFGLQHVFWQALSDRFDSPERFEFVYLMLEDDNPFLLECMKVVRVEEPDAMTKVDKKMIAYLKTKVSATKTLEFHFWEGISPGPLIAWTKDGEETIGLGFWMQLQKSTDGTPYVIVKRGPLFKDLQLHYEAVIHKARLTEPHGRLAAFCLLLKRLLKRLLRRALSNKTL